MMLRTGLWTEINHLRSKKFRVCVQLQYEQENVFSASDSANAAAADRAGVAEFEKLPSIWTKNFRKAPIRCIKENSSSDGIQRLPLRDLCRKMQYEAKGLTADMQLAWNRQKDAQANENDLIRQYKIPRWGSANPKRAQFPFDKTDGVFWPVVQPFDAIDLEDERHVTSADTRNQLICLSELTFASKLQLLCGRDDLFHRKRYMEAAEQDESKWQPGRFQHRIGYQRVVLKQSIDDARVKDIEQQKKEAAWMKRLVDLDAERISKASGNPRDYQKADEPSSSAMIEHIEFNLVDEYSKKRNGSRGLRPALKVPKDWLEVDIAHYMTASQRKDYLCSYINHRNALTYNHQPPKDSITGKEAVVNDELVQYHLNAVKAIFIHQSGYKAMGRSALLSEEDQLSAGRRLEAISTTINREKLHMDDLTMLCELQEWEEKYWTIIWDNLVNMYKNAYPLSELKLEPFIDKAFREAARVVQRGEYCSRFWYHVDKVLPV
ncbi:unnamed protein product [Heligmosomoides polygyrus]|uniref:Nuclear pore complex protein n=1 Tax=Heligmosomoides polygyrus TaxID=6339 RepID=A0A3P7Z752_HELPZ|nr:unnamed protein product [Heligmosomoides polygyrus]